MSIGKRSSTGANDSPIFDPNDDSLGFQVYVDALGDFILSCETPMTVAIQGDWGSGKTSLMNLIRASVTGDTHRDQKVRCVWINTWQFSQFDMGAELPFSVISLFSRQLSEDEPAVRDVLRSVRDLAMRASKGAAVMATAYLAGKDSAEALARLATNPEQPVDSTQRISEMRDSLQSLVKKAREKEGIDRFVIFVDDIDRLVPERAVELLEVLKVFLDLEGCVFVLACDYQVVTRGLRAKFGADSSDLKGKHFFDKIIQLPFSMPVGQKEVADYLRKRLVDCGIEIPDDDLTELGFYQELLAHSVGFNPRGLKRLTNCLRILRLVAARKGVLVDTAGQGSKVERERALFAALCMQTAFESLYIALIEVASWPGVDFKHVIDVLSKVHTPPIGPDQSAAAVDRFESRLVTAIHACERERPGSTQSIPLFVLALAKALQMKEGLSEELEPQEVAMFVSMLRFAAITATSAALQEQASRIDLSNVRPAVESLRQKLRTDLNRRVDLCDDSNGIWMGPIILGLGFTPWLGVNGEGALCFSADITTSSKSKIPAIREKAKEWCRELLEPLLPKDRLVLKKGNSLYGVVYAELEPSGFASRSAEDVQRRIAEEMKRLFVPLVKHLCKRQGVG